MEAASASSRQRVASKHGKHRETAQLRQADAEIKLQRRQISLLEKHLVRAEKTANVEDSDGSSGGATSSQHRVPNGVQEMMGHAGKVAGRAAGSQRVWGARTGRLQVAKKAVLGHARQAELYHAMEAPEARNEANHRDAVEFNYRHHDASWDGNRVPKAAQGDRLDRCERGP